MVRFWKTCLITLAIAVMGYCFGGQIPLAMASQEATVLTSSRRGTRGIPSTPKVKS